MMKAVTPLRKITAVITLTESLKAKRAATWLAPIMAAISSNVRKAVRERRAVIIVLGLGLAKRSRIVGRNAVSIKVKVWSRAGFLLASA